MGGGGGSKFVKTLNLKFIHRWRAWHAETRDRTGDLQIFSLMLAQQSFRGLNILAPAWQPAVSPLQNEQSLIFLVVASSV